MSKVDAMSDSSPALEPRQEPGRTSCPAPANFLAEVAAFDERAEHGIWEGPRYRLRYRTLGQGPPLVLIPGIASTYRGYALTLNRLAGRFRTIIYDYPGDHPDDRARLRAITHDHLVEDLSGLLDHLNVGRAFLFGLSFGSTVTLRALHREPRRFPKAVVQGAFARRRFTIVERMALLLGRQLPGTTSQMPLRERVLTYNSRSHFPEILADRWPFYFEQNGLTPIAALAHRLDLVARLDLRSILPQIRSEVLLLQGNEDRIVPRSAFEELLAAIPNGQGLIMPLVGHQPHYTHGEALAQVVGDWLLPCNPGGCAHASHCGPTSEK